MEDYSEYVPNVHFEQIPIKNLVSNQGYQRTLSQAHINKAVAEFDLYQINPVKVSRRDGVNYVFNGQHTIEIVAMASGSRDTPVWCMIYDDLSYTHEADIFANQMRNVKNLLPYEVFKANLEAGNHDQLMIKETVESFGLTIDYKKVPGSIVAVSALESIYTKYGIHVLSHVLRLCIGTWEGETNSLTANMLNALAKIIVTYNDKLDDELFKTKVGSVSPKFIARTAKERRPGSMGYAEAMVLIYNGKKKSFAKRLPLNQLFSKDFSLIQDANDFVEDEPYDIMGDDEQLYNLDEQVEE